MFKSFYMAGFECATGRNAHGEWIDQVEATQHDRYADEDYALIAAAGLETAREAIRWPLADVRGRYDFRSVTPFLRAARTHDVEIIWDLFHYGYPEDVDLFHASFPERFAEYCHAAARFIHRHAPGPYYFTPVNEGSFFAWAGGEVGLFAPHQKGRGFELKVALARAALAAIPAILSACPGARIVNVDPVCRVVPPAGASREVVLEAEAFNRGAVFEFLDMLAGKLMPDLGGSPERLDVVGLNYYATNQWELGSHTGPLAPDDPRRVSFALLVSEVFERYGNPVVVTETGHCDGMRCGWMNDIADAACELLDSGVPLLGVCLYPILGMPEWHDRATWARMGAWDLEFTDGKLERRPHEPLLDALRRAHELLSKRARTSQQRGLSRPDLSRRGRLRGS